MSISKFKLLIVFSLFIFSSIFAAPSFSSDKLKNVELSVAMGMTMWHASDSSSVISPYETDTLHVKNMTTSAAWRFGIGYHAFSTRLATHRFFNNLLFQLNVSHTNTAINGDVYQYESADYNNYSFYAPISSTQIMLDIKPTIYTYKIFSPYLVLGLGEAFNKVSYSETITGSDVYPANERSFASKQNNSFAYDLGLGLGTAINDKLTVSLEYLRTNMDKLLLADAATRFSINEQSVFLGINWKF